LDQNSLSFTGVQGGSNPFTQTVAISSTGAAELNWSTAVTSGAS
jgi:hypothetical protein